MNEWNIQTRATACESCQKEFTHQQPYHTLLFDAQQDYRRMDVCDACWLAKHAEDARMRKGFISYWQGIFELPAPKPEAIQKENAESLLRKLIEQNDPKHAPAAFILAVMLERKRILKVKEQFQRDSQRVFIYEQPKTGDLFTITDPNLQLNQLEAVQQDVAALLEHGLNPVAPIVADTGAVATDAPPPAATPADSSPGVETARSESEPLASVAP